MTFRFLLHSTDKGEHNAHNDYDDCQPYEEVSATHSSRSYAAEPKQRRPQRDNDQDKRIINKVAGHISVSRVGRAYCR